MGSATGTSPTNLTANAGADWDPAWSPLGGQIAFSTNRDGNYEIYTMTATGATQTRRTNTLGVDEFPTWSADESEIAFDSNRDGQSELYKIAVTGGTAARLTDGSGSDTNPSWEAAANTPPTISDIPDQTTPQNTPEGPIAFTVGDAETAPGSLTVTGSSSNTTLVPNANITFGGSGANRTVTVSPASGQTGTTTITVTVSDGTLTGQDTFVQTVTLPSGHVPGDYDGDGDDRHGRLPAVDLDLVRPQRDERRAGGRAATSRCPATTTATARPT